MGAGELRKVCFSQADRPGIAYFRSRESANDDGKRLDPLATPSGNDRDLREADDRSRR